MTKQISKEAQQIMEQHLAPKKEKKEEEEESQIEQSGFGNDDLLTKEDNNYFLSKIQSTKYNKQDNKELKKILSLEKKIRKDVSMQTMDLKGRVKTVYTHYFGKEDTYYPKMKDMLNIELNFMDKKTNELIDIKNQMNNFGQSLDNYFFNIIDEIESAYEKSNDAKDKRTEYHKQLKIIQTTIDEFTNKYDKNYCNLLRTQISLTSKLGKETETFAVNGYNSVLRMKEIENLKSITDLVSALNIGTGLTLEFSRVLNSHIKHTAPLYDLMPNLTRKEKVIENSQKKLANYIIKYKSVLAMLYQHKVNKLAALVGQDKAIDYMGYDTKRNIQELRK